MQQQQFTNVFLSFLIFLKAANLACGEIYGNGSCPDGIQTVANFNANAYLGTWYEYAKYPTTFGEAGRCIQADYSYISNNEIAVNNKLINEENEIKSMEGLAEIVSSGKLTVEFDDMDPVGGYADYWVLGTDYETYAVVYSCRTLFLTHGEQVWILTRKRDPSDEAIGKAIGVINEQNLPTAEIKVTNQNGCQ